MAREARARPPAGDVLVDTINQVFALFRLNYHNQFYSAFSDTQLLNQAKRLWLESLRHHDPAHILRAARQVIEESDYLPTLHRMLASCDGQGAALPSARDAYREACNAPSPKASHAWSHPAVYHAGRQTGWYELAHQAQALTWPPFKTYYEKLRRQAMAGVPLALDPAPVAASDDGQPLPREEQRTRLQALREQLDL